MKEEINLLLKEREELNSQLNEMDKLLDQDEINKLRTENE